jgi:hypothetical protein
MKKREILGLMAAGLLVATPMQSALAVTVSPGQSVVFNFYLPPGRWGLAQWDLVRIDYHFYDTRYPYATWSGVCFEGLDATGPSNSGCNGQIYNYVGGPGFQDGIFSWRLTNAPWSTTSFGAAPSIAGYWAGRIFGYADGTLASAPEPGTLGLLGLGLLGLGLTRRKAN